MFASKKKLDAAGVDPASLKTFDEFDAALAKLRDSLPADEPVIALGNKDQYAAIHLWGGIQGAYTPAQDVRDWIFQKDGATFDAPATSTALDKLKEWADKGYFGEPRRVQLAQRQRRGDRVRQGRGRPADRRQLERGDRQGRTGRRRHVLQHAARRERRHGRIGSTSFPMHISAKTKQPDLAAAYLDWITGPDAGQELADTQQVPAATDGTAEPGDPLGKDVKTGWDQLVEDGGLTLYPDWSSPTMLQTMGQSFQEMLVGRASPQDVIKRVQDDWEEYHQELAEG